MTAILTLLPLSLFLYILYTASRGQRRVRPVAVTIKAAPRADVEQALPGAFAP